MSFFSFQLNSYVILGQLAYWGRIKSDEKTPLNEIQVVEEPAAQSTNGSPTMEEKPPASMRIEQTSLASIKYTHLLNRCARLFSVCTVGVRFNYVHAGFSFSFLVPYLLSQLFIIYNQSNELKFAYFF